MVAYPCGTTGLSVVANRTSLSVVAYPCGTTGLSVVANRTSLSVTVRLALRLAVTVLGFLLLVLSDRPDADYD